MKAVARYGYGAKGIVYLTAGLLTAQFALGIGGKTSGSEDALVSILSQPLGQLLLLIIAPGLVSYSGWRALQAIFYRSPSQHSSIKSWIRRCSYGLSAIAYAGMAKSAFELLFDLEESSRSVSQWVYLLLQAPLGRWIMLGCGCVGIMIGLFYASRIIRVDFRARYDFGAVRRDEMLWLLKLAQLGWIARGCVFILVGVFAVKAGWQINAGVAKDSAAAMAALLALPGGRSLLFAIAFGLVLYSLQMLIEARYHPMEAVDRLGQKVEQAKSEYL